MFRVSTLDAKLPPLTESGEVDWKEDFFGAEARLTVSGQLQAENAATGKYRSTFDLHLTQPGTYRVAVVNQGLFASYKIDGQAKRWRGAAENFAREVPANAQDLTVTGRGERKDGQVAATAAAEVDRLTKEYMDKNPTVKSYSVAMDRVLSNDQTLKDRYHAETAGRTTH